MGFVQRWTEDRELLLLQRDRVASIEQKLAQLASDGEEVKKMVKRTEALATEEGERSKREAENLATQLLATVKNIDSKMDHPARNVGQEKEEEIPKTQTAQEPIDDAKVYGTLYVNTDNNPNLVLALRILLHSLQWVNSHQRFVIFHLGPIAELLDSLGPEVVHELSDKFHVEYRFVLSLLLWVLD